MSTTLQHPTLPGIPGYRILRDPAPGTATIEDVVRLLHREHRLCELIDGTLVEKPMGTRESFLAITIARLIGNYVAERDLGLVGGADGPYRMLQGNVRYPDVSFVPWGALPDGELPEDAIWAVVPSLAVEVLSESNTHEEMVQKSIELFDLGTQVMWLIDPATSTAEVWRPGDAPQQLARADLLDAAPALPGFTLPLADVFASLQPRQRPTS